MGREEFTRRVLAIRERLYRTAWLYLGSEADALEAVDEAVYQALRSLKKLRQPQFFETWLTRILINECKKELRRRHRFAPVEEVPETAALEALDHLPLKDAIQRLPEDLRAVIVLRYFAGLSQAETAEILGIPQGTAATRQRRALELLRLELGEEAST
ncbi:MAG: sigma-70 family RNA polymerase sigma factor [Oscillibacter sp.]|nr:sigma-70 family RNA polymerase sigma factor [Oscillibacter sp.]